MGKSNRIRNKKASAAISMGVAPKNKKKNGMPSWALNLITIAVAVVIFASVAVSLLVSNGVFSRMQTAAKSDNFRVDGNMMQYFYNTQYSTFVSQNQSYLTYYGIDTGASLKDQPMDKNKPEAGTWFDHILTLTKSYVTEMLAYCEEAEARGIKLDDEDRHEIEHAIEDIEYYATLYGYTNTNNYISALYGNGMKMKDLRKAMELDTLATKCAKLVGDEIKATITDDVINKEVFL